MPFVAHPSRVIDDPAHVRKVAPGPVHLSVKAIDEDGPWRIELRPHIARVLVLLLERAMGWVVGKAIRMCLPRVNEQEMSLIGEITRQLVHKRKLRLARRSSDRAKLDHHRLSAQGGETHLAAIHGWQDEVRWYPRRRG